MPVATADGPQPKIHQAAVTRGDVPAAQRAGTGWSRGLRQRPARLPRPLEFVTCKRQAIGIKGRGIAFICRLRFGSRRAERADLTKHVGLVRQEYIQVGTHQVDDSYSGHTCPTVLVRDDCLFIRHS